MPQWRTSSYSSESFNCVEVAYVKSSRSSDTANCVEVAFTSACNGGNCIEVGECCGDTLVRDSKDPAGPVLRFGDDGWRAFV
ncbi:MAG TPA: DUF397 domain-containing protein, partial [Jiangellaceae bacterium]|nr:DUF397 domain-containing protein [Jiangellaceae bacterium]